MHRNVTGCPTHETSTEEIPSESFLLRLPLEVLLLIAESIAKLRDSSQDWMSILPRQQDLKSLRNFSLSNKTLRHVCIAVGLFRSIRPHYIPDSFSAALEPLLSYNIPPLKSLTVDLGKPEVWNLCAAVIEANPCLRNLTLVGKPKGVKGAQLCGSKLGMAFSSFRGSSLTLKDLCLKGKQLQILNKVNGPTIKSLFFINSMLDVTSDWTAFPFRNLNQAVFIGPPRNCPYDGHATIQTHDMFSSGFLSGKKLVYFELSAGYPPVLSPDRFTSNKGVRRELTLWQNSRHTMLTKSIYFGLQAGATKSLRVFVHHDNLCGPLIDPWTRFDNQPPDNPGLDTSFENMKLLVFRCNRLKSLTSFDGSDDCTVGRPFRKLAALEADGWQVHSVWNHIAVFYAMFGMCDCILIETSPGSGDIDDEIWQFASERVMSKVGDQEGSLRFFIVGNRNSGFQGIERKMNERAKYHGPGRWIWRYANLDPGECSRIVEERWV